MKSASVEYGRMDQILYYYFISHIPITLLFDLQAIYPKTWVPQLLLDTNTRYVDILNDPFMNATLNTHLYWFKSFVFCEAFLQLPFFFIAIYGISHRKLWIRLPLIIYGAHVSTTVIPCLAEIMFGSLLTRFQLFGLLCLYLPYFFIPLFGAIDSFMMISKIYCLPDASL
ncbi:Transmembrane protein 97 [Rhizopus azygosporus]|uniref:Efficient mitochondria targeting-associated protein 19 n=2 Tax=Rhizopus TaxID=4842 RepID=A0A367KDQ0_RHIAZ|nr:Transmembrane protein 97 [Rhizopus azygosporus]